MLTSYPRGTKTRRTGQEKEKFKKRGKTIKSRKNQELKNDEKEVSADKNNEKKIRGKENEQEKHGGKRTENKPIKNCNKTTKQRDITKEERE